MKYDKKHVVDALESIEYWLMSDTHEGPTSGSDREDVYNSAIVLAKELRTLDELCIAAKEWRDAHIKYNVGARTLEETVREWKSDIALMVIIDKLRKNEEK